MCRSSMMRVSTPHNTYVFIEVEFIQNSAPSVQVAEAITTPVSKVYAGTG
jgi:hypothetical protein